MLTVMKPPRHWLTLLPLLLALLAGGALVFSGGVLAAPPDHAKGGKDKDDGDRDDDDGGDTPVGTVYFTLSGDTYRMNPDGSDRNLLQKNNRRPIGSTHHTSLPTVLSLCGCAASSAAKKISNRSGTRGALAPTAHRRSN